MYICGAQADFHSVGIRKKLMREREREESSPMPPDARVQTTKFPFTVCARVGVPYTSAARIRLFEPLSNRFK
jgi:hypothetical protein